MSNFGVRHLRLVAPYDVAFRNARSAVGASALLESAEVFETLAQALHDCQLAIGTTAVKTRALQHPLRELKRVPKMLTAGVIRPTDVLALSRWAVAALRPAALARG